MEMLETTEQVLSWSLSHSDFHTFSQHFAAIYHPFCRNSESVAGVAGDSGAAVAAATSGTTPMAPSTANPVTVAATPVAVPAAAATPAPAAAAAGAGAGPGVPVVGA